MRIGLDAGVWLRVVLAVLLGVSCGLPMAGQAVPTTNEVRAMRGLGPLAQAPPVNLAEKVEEAVRETAGEMGS